jgi:rod shape-determining protein MreD
MFTSSLMEKFDGIWRMLFAHGVTAILLLLSVVSFSLPYISGVRPFFVLMAIYYWAIYRPTLIPPVATFGLGIILDLLTGAPVGLNALLFTVLQWVVRRQRVFLMGQPFVMIWIGFGLTALLAGTGQYLAYMAMTGAALPADTVMATIALSFAAFAPVVPLFILVHRVLPHTARP